MKGYASTDRPWTQFFTEEALKTPLPRETIYENIRKNNESYPDNIALDYLGTKIRYRELLDNIDQTAGAFTRLGIRAGDVVACASITTPEMVYALYALNKIGATLMMFDPRRTGVELSAFLKDEEPKAILILDLAYPHLRDTLEELGFPNIIVYSVLQSTSPLVRLSQAAKYPLRTVRGKNVLPWKEFFALGKDVETRTADYGENPMAAITLTGGTTGLPKGVMLSNDGFNSVAQDFYYCGVPYTRKQKFMNIIPAFSSYGIVASLHMPLSLGLEIIVVPKFDPERVGHLVTSYRPEHTLLVPAHYEKLMNSREVRRHRDLSFFLTAGSGGDTMNEGLESKVNTFLKEHGCPYPLSQGYGMSEVSSAASCCCNGNFRSLSVGYPLRSTTISIFRPGTTEELPYGEEGEICITGPSVMLGYYKNQEETDKVLWTHPDGQVWVHSGDIGVMDEDGYLFIQGRIKRMITLFNGHKVFPAHIENVLGQHPAVESCAAVGVDDLEHAQGMKAVALVDLKDSGISDAEKDQIRNELEQLCHDEIEESSRPSEICFLQDMPRTSIGKIDYKKLAAEYRAQPA